jgi:hypothetical protein
LIAKVSILKISTEKKMDDLDRRENLDTLKKLVSTRRTSSISISIGLDCRDHQAYKKPLQAYFGFENKSMSRFSITENKRGFFYPTHILKRSCGHSKKPWRAKKCPRALGWATLN